MKSKEEIIQRFLDNCGFFPNNKSYNRYKSLVDGVWKNGYAWGHQSGKLDGLSDACNEEKYQQAMKENYKVGYDEGFKAGRRPQPMEKAVEYTCKALDTEGAYQRGFIDGKVSCSEEEAIDKLRDSDWLRRIKEEEYSKGYDHGSKKSIMESVFELSEKLKEERFESGYNEGYADGLTKGRDDGWSAARKVILDDCFGGLTTDSKKRELFDHAAPRYVLQTWDVIDVLAKIEEFESKQTKDSFGEKIEIGDEVETLDGNKPVKFIVLRNGCGTVSGISPDGGMYDYYDTNCKKTGKHFDVMKVLKLLENE